LGSPTFGCDARPLGCNRVGGCTGEVPHDLPTDGWVRIEKPFKVRGPGCAIVEEHANVIANRMSAKDMKRLFGAEHYGWVNACGAEYDGKCGEQGRGQKDECRSDEHGWVGAFDSEEESLDVAD
jgi:hypothetical protein